MLTKEQIFSAQSRDIKEVNVPEWGGSVYVRSLTVVEQTEYESELGAIDTGNTSAFTSIALAFFVCDENGVPLFTLNETREKVSTWSAPAVTRVLKAGQQINNPFTKDAIDKERGN